MSAVLAAPFRRDRLTWLMYVMLAGLAYQQGILGPLMPFLRDELHMSYTLGGILFTAIAIGMIFSGLISDRVARRIGRRAMFWMGGAGYVLGSFAIALSPSFPFAFAAVLFNSVFTSFSIMAVNATLSDHHGAGRTRAISEANVAAAASAAISPLLIGAFQASGLGWRWALFATVLVMGGIFAVFGSQPIPDHPASATTGSPARGSLPGSFWLYWLVAVCVVGFEWCFVVWGADYLADVVGFEPTVASTTMGVYLGGVVLGRAVGSWLARWWSARRLLVGALAIGIAGFLLFWLAPTAVLAVAGLGIAGLGVANLFPLTVSLAVEESNGLTNQATARVSMAVGTAIFAAPLVLGALADRFTLQEAFAIAPVIAALTAGLLTIAYRRRRLA